MSRNENARTVADAQLDLRDFGIAVGRRVRLVQQGHPLHAKLARLQSKGGQRGCVKRVVQRLRQGGLDEGIDFRIVLQQRVGVLRVGGQSLEPIDYELAEASDVLIGGGEDTHRRGLGIKIRLRRIPCRRIGQSRCICELRQQATFHFKGMDDGADNRLPVEIGVGDGDEQIDRHQMVDLRRHGLSLRAQPGRHGGQPLCHKHEQILHCSHFGLLAADAADCAALAACGLLALKAEHLVFHCIVSYGFLVVLSQSMWIIVLTEACEGSPAAQDASASGRKTHWTSPIA